MNFFEKLTSSEPTLSYEFFPPKNPQGWGTLYSTLSELNDLNLDFVSVTYGAGGSTREKTLNLVGRIQNELCIDTMAHLTCVGHSKDELRGILDTLKQENVVAIMALRGDPPKGEDKFTAHPDGFHFGSELISFIKDNYDFKIGCACYPEGHLESANPDQDVDYLKVKQDNGADFAVTQLFFDNEDFYRFRDKAEKAGVTIPLVAGIMPVTSISQLDRFKTMCGCQIPEKLVSHLGEGSGVEVIERGIEYGISQCEDLIQNGIAGLHLYTLNKSISSGRIIQALRQTTNTNS